MDARPFSQHNLRRAAEERRKAARALTEEARRTHLDLAEIFETRAGLAALAAADGTNVIQLRPKPAAERSARPRRAPTRTRSTVRTAPRAR
jgi:hypothetical protein